MRRWVLPLLVLSLPALAGPAEKNRERLASELVSFADWCRRKKLPEEAKKHLAEALALLPAHEAGKKLEAKLREPIEPAAGAKEAHDKEWAGVVKKIVPLYLALAADEKAGDAKQRDAWLLRARTLAPEDAAGAFEAAWRAAVKAREFDRVVRLLGTVPEDSRTDEMREALKAAELAASVAEPILRTAKGHPMKYFLSLPRGWSPEAEWPILVTADGAGRNWKGSCLAFMQERDKAGLPFIVVSIVRLGEGDYPADLVKSEMRPASFDEWFDLKGATIVAGEVAEEFHGKKRWYQTGFSAGGAVTWYLTVFHPERLAASAPACGGFGLRSAPGEEPVSKAPERETLPVRVFQGVDDKLALGALAGNEAGLREQWKVYADSFAVHGFKDVQLVLLPGVGHSPCAAQVTAFFAEVLKGGK